MPPFTRLLIPTFLLEAMLEHARSVVPNECCGLLAGRVDGVVGVVSAKFALGNDLNSPREYLSNPRDMLHAMKAMRRDGIDVLAIYHSHPNSAPLPSRTDLERNVWGDQAVHIIIGLAGIEPDVRAWWLSEADFQEAELAYNESMGLRKG